MPTIWQDKAYAKVAKSVSMNFLAYFRPASEQADEQKKLFMAGDIRNPHYTYPGIRGKRFGAKIDRLEKALEPGSEFDEAVGDSPLRPLYEGTLRRRLAQANLARAAQRGAMDDFARYNRAVDYVPRLDIYQSMLWSLERRLADAPEGSHTELLREILPVSDGSSLLPSSRLIRQTQDRLLELCEYMGLPTRYRHTGYWDAAYFAGQLQRAMDRRGMEGWNVELSNKVGVCTTNGQKRRIFVPESQVVPAITGRSVSAHELLHAWRYWQGMLSGQYLLCNGTPTNAFIEEGVTTVVQQGVTGSVHKHVGEEAYLATSLAAGLVDGNQRDFRTVYEIMVMYYHLIDVETPAHERAKKSPEDRAWIRANRVFRGSDCNTPGVFWGKDLIYAEGNLSIWGMLADHPERIDYFTMGKFNPANEVEVAALIAADLIPDLS